MYNRFNAQSEYCMWCCRMLYSRASNVAGAHGGLLLRPDTGRC